jgi:uncharacterized protein DUF4062
LLDPPADRTVLAISGRTFRVMSDKPVVFISSTSDFIEQRRALAALLHRAYEPYISEEDRARRRSPLEHLTKKIENTNVFVALLGTAYGSPFPTEDGEERSIVEWEFETARRRETLEIMCFVHRDAVRTTNDERQRRFLERVTGFREHWCAFFESPQELVELVRSHLEQWLADFFVTIQRRRVDSAPWHRRAIGAAGAAFVLISLGVNAPGVAETFTATARIAVAAIAGVIAIACFGLLQREIGGPR